MKLDLNSNVSTSYSEALCRDEVGLSLTSSVNMVSEVKKSEFNIFSQLTFREAILNNIPQESLKI